MKKIDFLQKINILKSTIFPFSKVVAGITLTNYHLFENGFSVNNSNHLENNDIDNTKQNIQILSNSIGINVEKLVFQNQIHSNIIQIIDYNNKSNLSNSDGLITNKAGLALCIRLADCGGVLCYDPINNAIGAFHSGWRGTKNEIVCKGINYMKKTFNSEPQNILVYISPAASKNRYEVGYDVAQYFPKYTEPIGNEKYLLDLHTAILQQLSSVGVDISNNVEVAAGCTIENTNYHSVRRDGHNAGRMTAFILIK